MALTGAERRAGAEVGHRAPTVTLRVCLEPGCGKLIPATTRRCPAPQAVHEQRQRARLDALPKHVGFYRTARWKRTRQAKLEASGRRGADCGSFAARLDVHHLIPVAQAPERAHDLENLVVLCKPCHVAASRARSGPMIA